MPETSMRANTKNVGEKERKGYVKGGIVAFQKRR